MPGGPVRGTDEHRDWVLGEIAAWRSAEADGSGRRAFTAWQRTHRRDAGHAWAVNRDVQGTWTELYAEAAGRPASAPVPYVGHRPPSSAARETQGDQLFPPVPPGFEAKRVSTYRNGQWTIAEPERMDDADSIVKMIAELPPIVGTRDYVVPPPAHPRPAELAACYVIGDHHLGMYADPNETGGAAWDAEHADQIFRRAFDTLTVEGMVASRAYIWDVGDFLHTDDTSNQTFRSKHVLDVSERWPRLFKRWRDMMTHAIDRCLEQHEDVVVEILPGNHNQHSASAMAVVLDSYYRNEPRVQVSQSDRVVRFHKWGECLIGGTHGHTIKIKEMAEKVPNLAPKLWGATTRRYMYTGHTHHTERHELGGVTVEVFRPLSPNDAHAAAHGHSSGRSMERLTLHKRRGQIATNRVDAEWLEWLMREESEAA